MLLLDGLVLGAPQEVWQWLQHDGVYLCLHVSSGYLKHVLVYMCTSPFMLTVTRDGIIPHLLLVLSLQIHRILVSYHRQEMCYNMYCYTLPTLLHHVYVHVCDAVML